MHGATSVFVIHRHIMKFM